MLFNSLPFLYFFLPITYLVFWRLSGRTSRYVWLTLTGYVFYGFWNYQFCPLLAFSTLMSYWAGRGLLAWTDPRRRTLCLVLPIAIDLLILVFFKYVNFGLESVGQLAQWVGLSFAPEPLAILLPIGISFYTFHNISYLVDSYRGVIVPTRNFWEYASYVSLFSQLVAGPIVRFREIKQDLDQLDRVDRFRYFQKACSFFAIGMIEKVLIADSIAAFIDPALADYAALSTLDVWLCMLGYTYQLYFDFCGYSDMAVGLGYLFGLQIPRNFNSPYQAATIQDFWRRWHISLFSCLRDYVYIPLGGNRVASWLVARNVLLTMLIGGIWHGANWTFIYWGLYHGLLLVGFRLGEDYWARLPGLLQRGATFLLVVVAWTIFRSDDLDMAGTLLQRMWFYQFELPAVQDPVLVGLLLLVGAWTHLGPNTFEMRHEWGRVPAGLLALFFVGCLLTLVQHRPSPFLYFQF
ncbi:MAG: MBOAT family protein [Nitrospira sp.]|nr:MAG: MBOAT family protein [Nitrospira sp.]